MNTDETFQKPAFESAFICVYQRLMRQVVDEEVRPCSERSGGRVMANYTVFDNGRTLQGDADLVLEAIRCRAAENNPQVAVMTTAQYASTLIEDAPYFLDPDLLAALKSQRFESDTDRALTYLAQMPTSGVRIMTVRAA